MKKNQYELFGHTLEIGPSGTGSCDPWTLDYASELGVGLMVTADLATFLLVDNEFIYKFESSRKVLKFIEKISNNEFETFDELEQYLSTIATKSCTLTEAKESIDRLKETNEKISKMTKEEKKEFFDSLRNERRRIVIEND